MEGNEWVLGQIDSNYCPVVDVEFPVNKEFQINHALISEESKLVMKNKNSRKENNSRLRSSFAAKANGVA